MNLKKTMDFLMSQMGISCLTVGVGMYNIVFTFFSKNFNIIGLILLGFCVLLTYQRWSLGHELSLIEKYSSLTKLLGELSRIDSKSNHKISEVIEYPPKNVSYSVWWIEFFRQERRGVDRRFNELNEKLNKAISIPYRLIWWRNTLPLIETEFIGLFSNTKMLYNALNEIVNCEKINPVDLKVNFREIEATYEDFIKALNESQNKEIKETIPKELLSSLQLPIPKGIVNLY